MHAACGAIDADHNSCCAEALRRNHSFTCENCLNKRNKTGSNCLSTDVSVQCSSFVISKVTQTEQEYHQSIHIHEQTHTPDRTLGNVIVDLTYVEAAERPKIARFVMFVLIFFKVAAKTCVVFYHPNLCLKSSFMTMFHELLF